MVITRTGKICVANGSLYVGSGSFWQRTSLPPGHPVTYCLEEDPANPETLYLGTSKGLFFTRDLGATWFPLNDDLVDPNGYVYPILALAFHPQTPGIVYAGTWNGILRTVNGGITWDLLNPACRNTVALAFDPADSDTIYAGSKAFEGGIFRSQDAGATWTPLGLGGIQVQAIGVSASKPGLLYAGTSHRDLYTSGGLYISEDYGQTWVVSRKGCTYGSVQSLVVDSGYPGLVLAGADDGVFRSEDHGVTWSTAHPEVNTVLLIGDINIHPRFPDRVLAIQGNYFYKSQDGGASWSAVSFFEGFWVQNIARSPSIPDLVYALVNDGSIAVSEDSGESWSMFAATWNSASSVDALALPTPVGLVVHPTNPLILFALRGGRGIAKSTDGGHTWNYCNSGLPGYNWGVGLAIDPSQTDTMYLSLELQGIYRTTDGGNTWTPANAGLTSIYVNQIVIDPENPSTVYASAVQADAYPAGSWGPGGVYRSVDRGLNWTRCPLDLPLYDDVMSLALDAEEPSDIYAGTASGEFLVSHNQGQDWEALSPSFPEIVGIFHVSHIYPLLISPSSPKMFYVGSRQGIYCLTQRKITGYYVLGGDGGVFAFGQAHFQGSLPGLGITPNAPLVNLTATRTGNGYYLLGADGGVFAFGDAAFHGSIPALGLSARCLDLEVVPAGDGYYLLGEDGGVFAFGQAPFVGSLPSIGIATVAVDMEVTPTGRGYWVIARDGGVFSFGDARFWGSLPQSRIKLLRPLVRIKSVADGAGYYMLGEDGGVFAFGSARFMGSPQTAGIPLDRANDLEISPQNRGYFVLGGRGELLQFGEMPFFGSLPALGIQTDTIDLDITTEQQP